MTPEAFNAFCATLPHTTHVVQWGGADVWKVGGKVFAIAGWQEGGGLAVSFKVTPIGYEILSDADGCRPAPYLASRGMKWIQVRGITDNDLMDHVRGSYDMIVAALPKKTKRELGLL
ncbi:MmcQ/YjbR family DNA-binding protein [Asticcacaulis sp.]|uniref:MmcQ/YjbR family DNA-binding protein n=1 Tax=Asticcacaulis sp. TaxID=1872648 RepID=UPI002C9E73ED|nr:MmcQ/YjbR family DNA-binding protein [Asticcacaulis sp.]HTM81503.1 MmcQ/YjbR family DNA-binding protein [Asticcacaulis sp.]